MTKHAPGAPLPASIHTRILLVFFGMFQITLAAGLVVGWAGIAGSMLVSMSEEGGAGLTLDQTTQLYGLAAAVNYISPLFLGILLDNYGPRACSTFSNATVAIGCLIFAMATEVFTFALGIAFIAAGGPGVQTSLMHTGNLFPSRRFFVMGCVAESITLSFAIFPLMDLIWEQTPAKLGFRFIFGALSFFVAISTVCSFLIWPDAPYEVMEERDKFDSETEVTREEALEEDLLLSTRENVKTYYDESVYNDLKESSLQEQLSSGVYIRLSFFFLVTSWWANFYIATVTTELGDQQRFDLIKQHELARLLSFIDAGAIVCAPLSGYLLDSAGFAPTAIITVLLGIFQMIFLLIAGTRVGIMVASFVAYAVFRAFLFPYFFASLSKKMGFRFFGLLSGISFCASGLSQLTIAPLALVVEGSCHEFDDIHEIGCTEGKWDMIHIIQTVTLLALVLIPVLDTCSVRVQKWRLADRLLDTSSQSYGSVKQGTEMIDSQDY